MTDEEIWYFKYNGFYCLPERLPINLIERLNQTTQQALGEMCEPIVWETGMSRRPESIRRLSKIIERHAVYLEAATQPMILDALKGVLGPHIELLTNKHNHLMIRPPGSDIVPWHSGEETYDPVLIAALIYLEESTLENGCIRLVPGSHMRPFQQDRRPQTSFYESPLYYRSVPMPMPQGGVLLFNDCCFHGATANTTDKSRRSMTLGYSSHDAHGVLKDDPEKILVCGSRIYTGHPHPFPQT